MATAIQLIKKHWATVSILATCVICVWTIAHYFGGSDQQTDALQSRAEKNEIIVRAVEFRQDKDEQRTATLEQVTLDLPKKLSAIENGQAKSREVPLRNALNEVLRGEYAKDCERGLARWNKILAEEGLTERIYLPSKRFHRRVGEYARAHFDIHGSLISQDEFERHCSEWLPTVQDREYVRSLMTPVIEQGKIANWIASPKTGINRQQFDFVYVRM